eukprot:g3122.t1
MSVRVGTHVKVGAKKGVVRFIGTTSFADGEWYGVELNEPKGKNDGTVNGETYFSCAPLHGLFCKKAQVRKDRSYKPPPGEESATAAAAGAQVAKRDDSAAEKSGGTGSPPSQPAYTPIVGDRARFKEQEGIIAFVGETQFSTGVWCGLVLDGPVGKNDGMVQGVRYFECKEKHGLFVRPVHLMPVKSLGSPAEKATVAKEATSTTPAPNQRDNAPPKSAEVSTPSAISTPRTPVQASGTSPSRAHTQSRLLREQRKALKANEKTISELREELQHKDAEIGRLRSSLSSSSSSPPSETKGETAEDRIRAIESKHATAIASLRADLESAEERANAAESKSNAVRVRLSLLESQQDKTQESARKKAAATSKVERRCKELEEEVAELNEMVENLTLEKEEFQLEKELAEEKAVDLQLELEHKSAALDDARAAHVATTSLSSSKEEAQDSHEDLVTQNKKLREALLRLRDSSAQEKAESERRLLALEKDTAASRDATEKISKLKEDNARLLEAVEDLKGQVDDASGFETLVEDLSERNMELTDEVAELSASVAELEELRDLSEEVEAQHVELTQQLHEELREKEAALTALASRLREADEREILLQRDIDRFRDRSRSQAAEVEEGRQKKLCKSYGLRAVGKTVELIDRLLEYAEEKKASQQHDDNNKTAMNEDQEDRGDQEEIEDNARAEVEESNTVPYPYRVLCARSVVILSDAEYYTRVLEVILSSPWGISDAQFAEATKRALPVQRQVNSALDHIIEAMQASSESVVRNPLVESLETSVSSMAMTTDRTLRLLMSAEDEMTSPHSSAVNPTMNQDKGRLRLRMDVAIEDVSHGVSRLSALCALMSAVLGQHHHAVLLAAEDSGSAFDGVEPASGQTQIEDAHSKADTNTHLAVIEALTELSKSHASMRRDVKRMLERLMLQQKEQQKHKQKQRNEAPAPPAENKVEALDTMSAQYSISDLHALAEHITSCRTKLARAVAVLQAVVPGEINRMAAALFRGGSFNEKKAPASGETHPRTDTEDEDSYLRVSCLQSHKSARERFGFVMTNPLMSKLCGGPKTAASLLSAASFPNIVASKDLSCPAFDRQARVLRDRVAGAVQLQEEQRALKATLSKRIQEVYMKQRELDTVAIRVEKLKKKVEEGAKALSEAQNENRSIRENMSKEQAHFEEALEEVHQDVDRLEAENHRFRKQLRKRGGTAASGAGSPGPREMASSSEISRSWRMAAKAVMLKKKAGAPTHGATTDKQSTDAEDRAANGGLPMQSFQSAPGLKSALQFVVAKNIDLRSKLMVGRIRQLSALSLDSARWGSKGHYMSSHEDDVEEARTCAVQLQELKSTLYWFAFSLLQEFDGTTMAVRNRGATLTGQSESSSSAAASSLPSSSPGSLRSDPEAAPSSPAGDGSEDPAFSLRIVNIDYYLDAADSNQMTSVNIMRKERRAENKRLAASMEAAAAAAEQPACYPPSQTPEFSVSGTRSFTLPKAHTCSNSASASSPSQIANGSCQGSGEKCQPEKKYSVNGDASVGGGDKQHRRRTLDGLNWVRGLPFYGYYKEEELFLRLELFDPLQRARLRDVLTEMSYEVYESDQPFFMQWLEDSELYPMGFLHLKNFTFRAPLPSLIGRKLDIKDKVRFAGWYSSQDVFEEDEYSEEDENENCSEADDLIDLIALNQEDLRESQDELVIQKLRQEEQEEEEDNNESDEEQETMDQVFALSQAFSDSEDELSNLEEEDSKSLNSESSSPRQMVAEEVAIEDGPLANNVGPLRGELFGNSFISQINVGETLQSTPASSEASSGGNHLTDLAFSGNIDSAPQNIGRITLQVWSVIRSVKTDLGIKLFRYSLENVAQNRYNVNGGMHSAVGVRKYFNDQMDKHEVVRLHETGQLYVAPNGAVFVSRKERHGVLSQMLKELLDTRQMIKKELKSETVRNSASKRLARILNARQLALKLVANVTYGYCAASFSGRMPNSTLADAIVSIGRAALEDAHRFVQEEESQKCWNNIVANMDGGIAAGAGNIKAEVVYGDTDSLFICMHGLKSRDIAISLGQKMADAITARNPAPVKMKFEYVYHPCILQTKKRYVGLQFERKGEPPTLDAKGIESIRVDQCPLTQKLMDRSLRLLFEPPTET